MTDSFWIGMDGAGIGWVGIGWISSAGMAGLAWVGGLAWVARLNARATEIGQVGAVAQRAHIHLRAGYKWGDCPPPRPPPVTTSRHSRKKL